MIFWKDSLMRLGIHEKWNAWYSTTRFEAYYGVELHAPSKQSLPRDSLGILCFVDAWEFNLDGIQLICIFDATVWKHFVVFYLDELIPIFAWMCGRHSKRGYGNMWIYPVCCDYVWTANCMMCF